MIDNYGRDTINPSRNFSPELFFSAFVFVQTLYSLSLFFYAHFSIKLPVALDLIGQIFTIFLDLIGIILLVVRIHLNLKHRE